MSRDFCCATHGGRSGFKRSLLYLKQLFELYDIPFWLEYGTLRGVIRYEQTNPWDDEADIGYFIEDHLRIVALRSIMENDGFQFRTKNLLPPFLSGSNTPLRGGGTFRHLSDSLIPFSLKFGEYAQVDMYAFYTKGPIIRHGSINWRWGERHFHVPRELLLPLKPCKYIDYTFMCPNKAQDYVWQITGTVLVPSGGEAELDSINCAGAPDWLAHSGWFNCQSLAHLPSTSVRNSSSK